MSQKRKRMFINVPPQHVFLEMFREKSKIIEYLLDKEFGDDIPTSAEEQRKNIGFKMMKTNQILEEIRNKKQSNKES